VGRTRRALLPWLLVAALGLPLALWARATLDDARGAEALEWEHPAAGWLGLAVPFVGWILFHLRLHHAAALGFTRVRLLATVPPGLAARLATLPGVLRVLALGALAAALARPHTFRTVERVVDSADVMVVFDLSRSMEEADMAPRRDRFDAAQNVVRRFVADRDGDRVGLAVFAEGAMLQSPLTDDLALLDWVVADLRIGDVPENGTAIGDGLGMALGELRRSTARSRFVVLLSDGDNNVANAFQPDEAAALARSMGVRVFTVLVGAEGGAWLGSDVNPQTLRDIAVQTGGRFFRATDSQALNASFAEVRQTLELDRRVLRTRVPDLELAGPLVALALLLLLVELALGATWLRRFP
jgi:Ca-activated chloride channel family protein